MFTLLTRKTQYDNRDGICGSKLFVEGVYPSWQAVISAQAVLEADLRTYCDDVDTVITDANGRKCYNDPQVVVVDKPLTNDQIPF